MKNLSIFVVASFFVTMLVVVVQMILTMVLGVPEIKGLNIVMSVSAVILFFSAALLSAKGFAKLSMMKYYLFRYWRWFLLLTSSLLWLQVLVTLGTIWKQLGGELPKSWGKFSLNEFILAIVLCASIIYAIVAVIRKR